MVGFSGSGKYRANRVTTVGDWEGAPATVAGGEQRVLAGPDLSGSGHQQTREAAGYTIVLLSFCLSSSGGFVRAAGACRRRVRSVYRDHPGHSSSWRVLAAVVF